MNFSGKSKPRAPAQGAPRKKGEKVGGGTKTFKPVSPNFHHGRASN
jgi:hypothetical protein